MSGVYKMAKRCVLMEKDAYNRLTAKKSKHSTKINSFQNPIVRAMKEDREKIDRVANGND